MSRLNHWLEGIRVLDLTRYRPGPFAAMLLADMQHLGPRDASGQPIFYRSLNGGKKARRMDLKSAAGRDAPPRV